MVENVNVVVKGYMNFFVLTIEMVMGKLTENKG